MVEGGGDPAAPLDDAARGGADRAVRRVLLGPDTAVHLAPRCPGRGRRACPASASPAHRSARPPPERAGPPGASDRASPRHDAAQVAVEREPIDDRELARLPVDDERAAVGVAVELQRCRAGLVAQRQPQLAELAGDEVLASRLQRACLPRASTTLNGFFELIFAAGTRSARRTRPAAGRRRAPGCRGRSASGSVRSPSPPGRSPGRRTGSCRPRGPSRARRSRRGCPPRRVPARRRRPRAGTGTAASASHVSNPNTIRPDGDPEAPGGKPRRDRPPRLPDVP